MQYISQLVTNWSQCGLFFVRSLWTFLGKSFQFFFHGPCWAQGAFLSAAFTNHILMYTCQQSWPRSFTHTYITTSGWHPDCHINFFRSTVPVCNPNLNFLNQRVVVFKKILRRFWTGFGRFLGGPSDQKLGKK